MDYIGFSLNNSGTCRADSPQIKCTFNNRCRIDEPVIGQQVFFYPIAGGCRVWSWLAHRLPGT